MLLRKGITNCLPNKITMINLYDNYRGLIWLLQLFDPDSEMHYHEYQSDDYVVREFLQTSSHVVDALIDAKRLLELPEFPSEEVELATRRFDKPEDVKPWFLSVLKLLEEEADKQGMEIPEDLRGLWKEE